MDIYEAAELVANFQDNLQKVTKNGNRLINENDLIKGKKELIIAFKISLSNIITYRYMTIQGYQEMCNLLNRVNTVLDEDNYARYKKLDKQRKGGLFVKKLDSFENKEYLNYLSNSLMYEGYDSVLELMDRINKNNYEISINEPEKFNSDEMLKELFEVFLGITYTPELAAIYRMFGKEMTNKCGYMGEKLEQQGGF